MMIHTIHDKNGWVRRLHSGQIVRYDDLPFAEAAALAKALDEWEHVIKRRSEENATEIRRKR